MAHLERVLNDDIARGAIWRADFGTQVVGTDGGHEVRNNRWSTYKSVFEIPYLAFLVDDALYEEVIELYKDAGGFLHTFYIRDTRDRSGQTLVRVRFDSILEVECLDRAIDDIKTLTLREVFP